MPKIFVSYRQDMEKVKHIIDESIDEPIKVASPKPRQGMMGWLPIGALEFPD